jgi:hypothetical protein
MLQDDPFWQKFTTNEPPVPGTLLEWIHKWTEEYKKRKAYVCARAPRRARARRRPPCADCIRQDTALRRSAAQNGGSGDGDDYEAPPQAVDHNGPSADSEHEFWNTMMVDYVDLVDAVANGKAGAEELKRADEALFRSEEAELLEKATRMVDVPSGGRGLVRAREADSDEVEADTGESPIRARKAASSSRTGGRGPGRPAIVDAGGMGMCSSITEKLIESINGANEAKLAEARAKLAEAHAAGTLAQAKILAVPAKDLTAKAQMLNSENQAKTLEIMASNLERQGAAAALATQHNQTFMTGLMTMMADIVKKAKD